MTHLPGVPTATCGHFFFDLSLASSSANEIPPMKEATLSSFIAGLETSIIAREPCTAISLVGAITRT